MRTPSGGWRFSDWARSNTVRRFQQAAERSQGNVDAVSHYRSAPQQSEQAVPSSPVPCPARCYWANCLIGLARPTSEPPQRQALLESARKLFAAGARCEDVEWELYLRWGEMLTTGLSPLATNAEERRLLLVEARQALNTGLELARFTADRAALERDLAFCLAYLAEGAAEPAEK